MKLDNRLTMLLAAILAVAIGAGAWFLGISPQLDAAATASQQTSDARQQNDALSVQLASLTAEKAKMADYTATLDKLKESVPARADTTTLLRQIGEIASATGVTLTGFSPSAPIAYTAPGSDTSTPVAAASTASPSPSATPSQSATPAPAPKPSNPAEYTDSSVTGANFQIVPITMNVMGTSAEVLAFLDALRECDRLIRLSSFSESPDDGGLNTLTVAGSAFAYQSTTTTAATTG